MSITRTLQVRKDRKGQWMYKGFQDGYPMFIWQYAGFTQEEAVAQAEERFGAFSLVTVLPDAEGGES